VNGHDENGNGNYGLEGTRYLMEADLKQTVAIIARATEANERQIREVARSSAEQFKEIAALVEKSNLATNARLENLATTFQTSQKPNYMLWLAAIAVFFTLVSAAWKITDLQTQVTMAPIGMKASANEQSVAANTTQMVLMKAEDAKLRAELDANTARDEVSEKDRATINATLTKHQQTMAETDAGLQVITAKLTEIETQFRAADQLRNVQFAEQQRMNNIMFQISQGKKPVDYPLNPYFMPSIASPGASGESQR
jgi:hypothetical protein